MTDIPEVVSVLAQHTAGLTPISGAAGDLRALRSLIAANAARVIGPDAPSSAGVALTPELHAELTTIAETGTLLATDAVTIAPGSLPAAHAASPTTPTWARAARPISYGPFAAPDASVRWFNVYLHHPALTFVRQSDGSALFAIPAGATGRDRFDFGPGTVAVALTVLTGSGNAGELCPVRVRGGALMVGAPVPAATGDTVTLPPGAGVTLDLQLDDAPSSMAPAVTLPTRLTIRWNGAGIATAQIDAVRLGDGAHAIGYAATGASFTLDAQLRAASLALRASDPAAELDLPPPGAAQLTVRGRIAAANAAFVLLAADASGTLLAADGAGHLVLRSAEPLRAEGDGLPPGGLTLRGVTLIASATSQLVLATVRDATRRRLLELWRHAGPASVLELGIPAGAPIELMWTSAGTLVLSGADAGARVDRPLRANGAWTGVARAPAMLAVLGAAAGTKMLVVANGAPLDTPPSDVALVLENALVKTAAPNAFVAFGTLAAGDRIVDAIFGLSAVLHVVVPTLPDPYAANLTFDEKTAFEFRDRGRLAAIVRWKDAVPTAFDLALLPIAPQHEIELIACGSFVDDPEPNPNEVITRSVALFTPAAASRAPDASFAVAQSSQRQRCVTLLDLSSNADLFGVQIAHDARGLTESSSPYRIDGIALRMPARDVNLLTLPIVSWEPVRTIPNPNVGPFPPVLASATDGGPTLIVRDEVRFVAVEPNAVYADLLATFAAESIVQPLAMLCTLPFGMRALARLSAAADAQGRRAGVGEVRPAFPGSLGGGHQLSITASGSTPGGASPSLPGITVQTRNGVDPFTGTPLGLSVLDDGVVNAVASIFDETFGSTAIDPHVPVRRLDLSGYGASLRSDWVNPAGQVADVREVRFDVNVGRTAFEVVQVASILYPWGVPVLRSVTMQRTGGGGVVRRDSGWIAAGDGVFDFRAGSIDTGIVTHPGVASGITHVRGIRETGARFTGSGADLVEVRFDGDVMLREQIVRGASAPSRVITLQQTGYIQVAPHGVPLTPAQFAAMIGTTGPLGGPVDCVIDVGGSGQLVRVTRVEVDVAPPATGEPQFALAAYGSPALPKVGQWSVVVATGGGGAEQIDPHRGTPLVREGDRLLTPAANPHPYRFAAPSDLLAAAPAHDYGFLHATGTQRVLFARPKIEPGSAAVTSALPPLLADTFALLAHGGAFPPAASAIAFPAAPYALDVLGDGVLRFRAPYASFTVGGQRDVVPGPPTRMYADYSDGAGTTTTVTYVLDPASWSFTMGPMSLAMDWAAFPKLMRTVFTVGGSSTAAPAFRDPKLVFGSLFAPVNVLMAILDDLGISSPMNVAFTNPFQYKLQAGIQIPFLQFDPIKHKFDDTVYLGPRPVEEPPCVVPRLNNSDVKAGWAFGGYLDGTPGDASAYFELEAQIWFPIVPEKCVNLIGMLKMHLETDQAHGTTVVFQIGVGAGVSFTFFGTDAKAWVIVAFDLVVGDVISGLGASLIIGFSVDLFEIVAVQVQAEARGVLVTSTPMGGGPSTQCLVGQFTAQIEVSICFVLDFSAQFEYDMDKRIAGDADCDAITTP